MWNKRRGYGIDCYIVVELVKHKQEEEGVDTSSEGNSITRAHMIDDFQALFCESSLRDNQTQFVERRC